MFDVVRYTISQGSYMHDDIISVTLYYCGKIIKIFRTWKKCQWHLGNLF